MKNLLLLTCFLVTVCLGADRFRLQTKLRTNFADNGSSTQFLTGYTYDANGNRVLARAWNGVDSALSPMSTDQFTYNSAGRVSQELLLSGNDTSSIVRYVYSDTVLIAVHTLAKDGALRFTDSLLYNGLGRNIEEDRISSAGVKTFYHRYNLNASGKIVADTLYELDSTSYVAEQAVLFTYNSDMTVATEAQWQLSGASWYCISTAFMSYAGESLVSVATHERDGVGTGMTDSLAYTYDQYGNRTKEADYDGTKTLTYDIVYTWLDSQPSSIVFNNIRNKRHSGLIGKQGQLIAECGSHDRGEISIFDVSGKLLSRITVDHSCIVPPTGLIGKGSYVAVFTSGINKQILNFTKFN